MARLLKFGTDGKFEEIEACDLDDYYKALECDTFDIANRNICGKRFDIFVDDIGLFRESPVVTAIMSDFSPALVGNLVFANHDMEGNTTSLSDEDIAHIKSCIVNVVDADRVKVWTAIFPVDY